MTRRPTPAIGAVSLAVAALAILCALCAPSHPALGPSGRSAPFDHEDARVHGLRDVEPNDDVADAEPVGPGTVTGTLSAGADPADLYRVEINGSGLALAARLSGPSGDLFLGIRDANGTLLDHAAAPDGRAEAAALAEGGSMIVEVSTGTTSGGYTLELWLETAPDDPGTWDDPEPIAPPGASGWLHVGYDEEDVYAVDLACAEERADQVSLRLTSTGPLQWALFPPGSDRAQAVGAANEPTQTTRARCSGAYRLRVWGRATVAYSVELSVTSVATDGNDNLTSADEVMPGEEIAGEVRQSADRWDCYRVRLLPGETLLARLDTEAALDLRAYCLEDGVIVDESLSGSVPQAVEARYTGDGWIGLEVESFGEGGSYVLRLGGDANLPPVVALVSPADGAAERLPITLAWKGEDPEGKPVLYDLLLFGGGGSRRVEGLSEAVYVVRSWNATALCWTVEGFDGVRRSRVPGPRSVSVISNRPPTISGATPEGGTVLVSEGEALPFSVSAQDPDGDPLTVVWSVDGAAVGEGSSWNYTPGFDDNGTHAVAATVTDGGFNATRSWSVVVADTNRPPVPSVQPGPAVDLPLGGRIALDAGGSSDPDGDKMTYLWSVDGNRSGSGVRIELAPGPGTHVVGMEASDGRGGTAVVYVTIRLPDPVIEGVAVPDLREGRTARLRVSLGNRGAIPALALELVLWVDGSEAGATFVDLPAGGRAEADLPWLPAKAGGYDLRVTLRWANQTHEDDPGPCAWDGRVTVAGNGSETPGFGWAAFVLALAAGGISVRRTGGRAGWRHRPASAAPPTDRTRTRGGPGRRGSAPQHRPFRGWGAESVGRTQPAHGGGRSRSGRRPFSSLTFRAGHLLPTSRMVWGATTHITEEPLIDSYIKGLGGHGLPLQAQEGIQAAPSQEEAPPYWHLWPA